MTELTDDDWQEIRENFEHFDGDRDGRIDFSEFHRLLDALGGEFTEAEARIGFAEIDTDGGGRIEIDEFADWWIGAR
jgi:calcium-binding protein CML